MFFSLGNQPPSNSFISEDQIKDEKIYPLEMYLCNDCYLTQLLDVVSAETIFDEYHYLSSSSKALVKHFKKMTSNLANKYDLKPLDLVVDIGCNDGITLNTYDVPELRRVGVEPSKVAEIAEKNGFDIIKSFFSIDVARNIVSKFGKAKIITATNVFAHVDDMHDFVEGIPHLLEECGVFIVEVSYLLDLINNKLFDTIYHEHLCYLCLTPIVSFLKQFEVEVFHVEKLATGASGPSVRLFIQKCGCSREISKSVDEMLEEEKQWSVDNIVKYKLFAESIKKIKTETWSLLNKFKSSGLRIGGFGAPAKGNTLLNHYEISTNEIECIADNTTLKQGKLTPGSHIPIVDDNEFLAINPDYALLLSWNYLDFFLENSEYIKKGGKFIVPLPSPRILPN